MLARTTQVNILASREVWEWREHPTSHTIRYQDGKLFFDDVEIIPVKNFNYLSEEQQEAVIDLAVAQGFELSEDSSEDEDKIFEIFYAQLSDKKKLKFSTIACPAYYELYNCKITLFLDYLMQRVISAKKPIFGKYFINETDTVYGEALNSLHCHQLPDYSGELDLLEDGLNKMHI